MDNIFKKALKIGKKLAREAYDECDGDYVGEELHETFEFEGLNYEANYSVFWESSNHFDCSVNGVDNGYYNYKCCNDF